MDNKLLNSKWKTRFKRLARDMALVLLVFAALDFWNRRGLLENRQLWREGVQATNVSLMSMDGDTQQLLEPGKTHFIYFFAPWCQVCGLSIGNLQDKALGGDFDESVRFRFVALDYEDRESVAQFVTDHQLRVPVYLGDRALRDAFAINAYPTIYIVSDTGEVLSHSVGYTSSFGLLLRLWWFS